MDGWTAFRVSTVTIPCALHAVVRLGPDRSAVLRLPQISIMMSEAEFLSYRSNDVLVGEGKLKLLIPDPSWITSGYGRNMRGKWNKTSLTGNAVNCLRLLAATSINAWWKA